MRRIVLGLCLVALPMLVYAQSETTGRITGQVVGEDDKPVAGARVTVNSPALLGHRSFTTDEQGKFLASLLPPGEYTVTISAAGMETVGYKVTLGIGQTAPLDVVLKAGGGEEQVVVYGDLSRLETTAGGENFNYDRQLNNLPIVSRVIDRVAELAPNVAFGPTPGTLSISGAPSFDTVVLLDGAEISDPYFGSGTVVYVEEAIEEVQVLTGGVSAKYGRFQGGVISATTKSGGNTYDGSLRYDLDKESWNEKTPYSGQTQSETYNRVYSATVGGPILKDRLTFFASGRTIPTSDLTGATEKSGLQFVTSTDEDRYQGKLTGAINPNHIVETSYLKLDRKIQDSAGLPPADLRALAPRDDPREIWTADYQGVLSENLFLNVQGTRKRVSILSGGDPAKGSPFLENIGGADFQIWHNHWWDFTDPTDRDNDTLGVNLTQALSTGNWGDHTLEYGVQWVKSSTGGENRQSSTGLNLLSYTGYYGGYFFADVTDPTVDVPPADPNDPRFNLVSYYDGGVEFRWKALPLGGGQELENTALYVQDTWQKGKWRVDAGLRWEKYEGKGPEPTLNLDFDDLAPRLGVTYNLDNNWQLQATWGKYVSRFNDAVASNISGVGGAPYIFSLYTGPTGCAIGTWCLDYDGVEALVQNDDYWNDILITITDPKQPTRFLGPNVKAPYANDLNLAVKRALPRNSGTVELRYTKRKYRDLLDDFRGDQIGPGDTDSYSTVVDPEGSGATFFFDTEIWKNAPTSRRDYEALTAAFDYRPGAKWDIGGNWTFAETRGNYEGEGRNTPSSGSIIGDYPRSLPLEAAIPYGFTDDDIRHRVRAWGDYRFDFARKGSLILGAVGLYQSGANYNKIAGQGLNPDPIYLNERGQIYTHFFDGRGNNLFNGFWRLDWSGRYQFKIWKDLNAYLKLDILNITNNDELISFQTSGVGVTYNGIPTVDPTLDENDDGFIDGTGTLIWEPTGLPDDFNPNQGGPDSRDPFVFDPGDPAHVAGPGRFDCLASPSEACTGFGRIPNQGAYQSARSYFLHFGVQW